MKKPIIAIDIDDVISSQVDAFIKFSNENYGMNLTIKDFQTPGEYWGYYEMVWGVDQDEADRRFRKFLGEGHPLKQIITDEVKQSIAHLKTHYDLDVVTSRHAEISEATRNWLIEHFPATFRGIHFVALWDSTDKKATKAVICQEIGAEYLIDDNAEHCNLAAEAGVQSLLLGTYGWNSYQQLHPGVIRVANWGEVIKFFDGKTRD